MVPGELRIRRGTRADVEAAAAVQCASALVAFAHIFPPDAPKPTAERLVPVWRDVLEGESAGVVLVAERRGSVVGVAVVHTSAELDRVIGVGGVGGVGHLSKVYVLPEAWSGGVGNRLLSAALEVVAEAGCPSADLWVLEHNRRARAWYERHGWVATGAVRTPFPTLDLVELQHRLEL